MLTLLIFRRYAKMGGRFGELLLIFLIVLVLFGAGRIPKIMRDIGAGLNAFKDGMKRGKDEDKSDNQK
ncbi:twin-arginine translocase TatA/TatE family subunit [Candidatus Lariskella endosymbiont of Hedychridium roseum]|uniref:twin-arginine translocase TatA/TatE family subunit n=2 Tax=unclassified Candidatus Lariskella TaxID=2632605 RepID=UPI003977C6ED